MKIGIDGSRAFINQRTGIEEYSYQVIKHLVDKLNDHEVILYVSTNYEFSTNVRITNIQEDIRKELNLPQNWSVKIVKCFRFWTQLGLSLEMLLHPVDVLFVPAHTVPFVHPRKTIVTVHGLEYEVMPHAYSFWERFYMRLSIKNSCHWAQTIIAVSENTKKDLMKLYQVPEKKIQVVYEGYSADAKSQISNLKSQINPKSQIQNHKPCLLFIGRLEERKNILGIIKAFEILKEQYKIPHKLVLAGRGGYGFSNIELVIGISKYKNDIIQLGFVKDEDKFNLIAGADVFMFPTFYEGFGIPILEAQSVGVPVVTSNTSSMPEVAGDSAMLVDPKNCEEIARATYKLISDKSLKDDIIKKGSENVQRFSWEKCAQEIVHTITD